MYSCSFGLTAVVALSLAACGGPTPPSKAVPTTQVSVAEVAPPPGSDAIVAPAAAPAASSAASPEVPPEAPPRAEPYVDLHTAPGDVRLDAGAALLKDDKASRARPLLQAAVVNLDRDGSLDAKMAGHALLARACQASKDITCAASEYQRVRELWQDPTQAMDSLGAAAKDEQDKKVRAQRALNALGEATFFVAEQKRAAADAERFPAYRGSGTKDDVLKHINTKIGAWLKARRAKVQEAEQAYGAVVAIRPAPHPHWVIASASRVGDMWGKLFAEFRAAPIPSAWKQNGPVMAGVPDFTYEDLRTTYYQAIDDAAAPMKASAKAAYLQCWELSKKLGSDAEYAKHCEAWLAKNSPPVVP